MKTSFLLSKAVEASKSDKKGIAFVHCWIMPWGALNVLKDLIIEKNSNTDIQIFTIFSNTKYLEIDWKIKVITALPWRLNSWFLHCSKKKNPLLSNLFDYRNLMFFYPLLMKVLSRKIKKYNPKEVVISSFAVAKNLSFCKNKGNAKNKINTKLYLHSPMQYIRSHYDDYIQNLKWYKKLLFKIITPHLRKWDKKYTKYNDVICNSKYTSRLAKKIYHIESKVKYPKTDKKFLKEILSMNTSDYYVFSGRISKLIRNVDLVIEMCNTINIPLLVMWSGPDEMEMKQFAGDSIIFLGWIDDVEERISILKQAKGLINISKESFGIWTFEALCLWVPVFAYDWGGSAELIHDDNWFLTKEKTLDVLIQDFKYFQDKKFDREIIAKKARMSVWY